MIEQADIDFYLDGNEADAARRSLVPYLDAVHRTILDLLPEGEPGEPLRILDLGPGTGLLAERILRTRETAEVTLIDLSETALAMVRERLEEFGDRVTLRSGDYVHMTFDHPQHAIIAELSVHHLNPKTLRTLFSASYAALGRGGVFIKADQVRGETEAVEALHVAAWRRDAERAGAAAGELDAALSLHRENRPSTVETIVECLSDDGFEDVSCHYKQWGFAVLAGTKV